MIELHSTKLFGVKVTTDGESRILEYLLEQVAKCNKPVQVTTPNPEIIMYAKSHSDFAHILNTAEVGVPDGVGLTIGAYLMGKGPMPRVTGVDLMEKLCSKIAKSPYSTGFYGAQPGVAEKTAECLQKKYSGLKVSYASDVWDKSKMKGKKIDILFVAMGHPKQEEWISQNLSQLPVAVAMGVGGSFDFISGVVPRAPHIFRKIGLEWLYRLVRQPWRWKRQLALISFSLLVFKEAVATRIRK